MEDEVRSEEKSEEKSGDPFKSHIQCRHYMV